MAKKKKKKKKRPSSGSVTVADVEAPLLSEGGGGATERRRAIHNQGTVTRFLCVCVTGSVVRQGAKMDSAKVTPGLQLGDVIVAKDRRTLPTGQ
eukprot:SAG11_NODE_11211_length_776_cov_1.118168_1_plen_93_part_10